MDHSYTIPLAGVVVALIGALLGSCGVAAFMVRREQRSAARLIEGLAASENTAFGVASGAASIRDARLRAAVGRMAERMAETWQLATVDAMCGIPNRQSVLARLEAELERAIRYSRPLSVVLMDLDHFKRLNDSYGHDAGDRVLRELAQLVAANIRSVDTIGRYGGEEFLLLLPETEPEAAAAIAEKLRWLIASREIMLADGDRTNVTVSAGVAGGAGAVLRLDPLVRDADAALYSAKALGRNQVFVFRETGDDGTVRKTPIDPAARQRAVDVGKIAMAAAQDALLRTIVDREGWAGKPSTLIAEASVQVAAALGLPVGELERIRTASLLHDLGKLAIPDEILQKPGELAEGEWRIVAEHPKIGQVVLEQAGALRDSAMIVLHHHEWFDGRGYPLGLVGNDIPVGARIVSIADAYEAMVAGRPYRPAITHHEALAELGRQAGCQFDPQLVAVFSELFASGMPWEPESPWRGPTADAPRDDQRTQAEIHDQLHDRRRRVVRTGTDG